jgi:hypothetical protein
VTTDLGTLRAVFDRADVRYEVNEATGDEFPTHPTTTQVLETAGAFSGGTNRGTGNLGYFGFFTGFGFDADGKLLWVGAWE